MTRNLTVTGWSYSLAVRIPYLVAPLLAAGAIALTASGTIAQAPAPVRAPASGPPRLVVILVADQFRADYVTQYSDMWTAGLKEIFAKGAAFTEAAYPYANTRTCPGHATIGTGMLPSVHGMIDNTWYNVATHEFLACTEDHQARSLPFGGFHGAESHSAKWYLVPNFADELKRQVSGRPRVVSLSLKARSAIGLGGHGGADSTIVWKEDGAVTFATSSALAKAASPALDAFVRSHPVSLKQFETWDRAKPEASYKYTDQAPGEPANRGTFPHLFNDPVRLSDTTASILDSWDGTPAADEYLGAMAEHLITEEKLGQRQTTDFLAVSFSTLDIVGHDYGPRSHEVQDVLLRLDATIGRLLAVLDAKVGRDRYVLAFSSDHGVATLPEQVFPAPAGGRGAGGGGVTGRVTAANVANAVEAALDKHFGRGHYVEALAVPYLYFVPGVLERIRANPSAVQAVEAAVVGVRGIAKSYWTADIAATTDTSDPTLIGLRRSYYAGRSGDLAIVYERNWTGATGANHGSPQDYDRRVPLAFLGAGITSGQHAVAASPVDIVPTLSAITGVRMSRTDGRVLREALADPGTR
jgi:predicted AlkP superfamily pyrophosphatase or phosphodiesterase